MKWWLSERNQPKKNKPPPPRKTNDPRCSSYISGISQNEWIGKQRTLRRLAWGVRGAILGLLCCVVGEGVLCRGYWALWWARSFVVGRWCCLTREESNPANGFAFSWLSVFWPGSRSCYCLWWTVNVLNTQAKWQLNNIYISFRWFSR
jgi:hypothetical protein